MTIRETEYSSGIYAGRQQNVQRQSLSRLELIIQWQNSAAHSARVAREEFEKLMQEEAAAALFTAEYGPEIER